VIQGFLSTSGDESSGSHGINAFRLPRHLVFGDRKTSAQAGSGGCVASGQLPWSAPSGDRDFVLGCAVDQLLLPYGGLMLNIYHFLLTFPSFILFVGGQIWAVHEK
jgi:hypothetical protein